MRARIMHVNAAATTPRPARSAKPDAVCAEAVELAREAAAEAAGESQLGDHLGYSAEAERVVTHYFASTNQGYVGWRWAVTVTRASRQRVASVNEVVLLPGDDAILAPPWVPWAERVRPEDLGPGDLLPRTPDDPRLVPAHTASDPDLDPDELRTFADELGIGRSRVLSAEGRELAAERWYGGPHGPDDPVAKAAPAKCATCGFLVRLRGELGTLFGVCANTYSPSDGGVVSFDHGCGAHSEVVTIDFHDSDDSVLPVLDTLGYDGME